jgi:PPM family protein phosphatase
MTENGPPSFDRLLSLGADLFPPLSATTRAEFAALTRTAPEHSTNEDHYLVTRLGRNQETLMTSLPPGIVGQRFDEYAYAMVVADGMGHGGEVASRLAVAALLELALRFGQWRVRVEEPTVPDIMDRITTFYRQIDAALVHINRAGIGLPLSTTLTATVSGGRDLFFVHVGHSRAYLLRDGALTRLTRDHTHEAARGGVARRLHDMTNAVSDRQHLLTDALGAGTSDPEIDIERITLVDGDLILLSTNGLTDAVDDAGISAIVRQKGPLQDLCAALLDRAAVSGQSDDATVVMARYRVPE